MSKKPNQNNIPDPTSFGEFDIPPTPTYSVLINKVGEVEQTMLPVSEIKLSQIPNNPKQFLVSLIIPNYKTNPYQDFSADAAYTLVYQYQTTTLHFRATYKGFNLLTRKEEKKIVHEINLIFSGVLLSNDRDKMIYTP